MSVGDIRTPYQTAANDIKLGVFAYPTVDLPITVAYWTRIRSLSSAAHVNLYDAGTPGGLLFTFGYRSTGAFYVYCKSLDTAFDVTKTAVVDEWIHHTIALQFNDTIDELFVNYAINGGMYNNGPGIMCTRISTQPSSRFVLYQNRAFFRDFKVFNHFRKQIDVNYTYRHRQKANGEFILYYDFMDPPGSAGLRDLQRPDMTILVNSAAKHDSGLVWLPLYAVPVICKNGTLYDPIKLTCAGKHYCAFYPG